MLRWSALTRGGLSCLTLSPCGRHLAVCAGGGAGAPAGTGPEILCFDVSGITGSGIEIVASVGELGESPNARTALWQTRGSGGRGGGGSCSSALIGSGGSVRIFDARDHAYSGGVTGAALAAGVRLESRLSGHAQVSRARLPSNLPAIDSHTGTERNGTARHGTTTL